MGGSGSQQQSGIRHMKIKCRALFPCYKVLQQEQEALDTHERMYLLHTFELLSKHAGWWRMQRVQTLRCRQCGRLSRLGYSCRKPFPVSVGEMKKCKLEHRHILVPTWRWSHSKVCMETSLKLLFKIRQVDGNVTLCTFCTALVTLRLSRLYLFPARALLYFVSWGTSTLLFKSVWPPV